MRYFYECGICECLHPCGFTDDCRDEANRFVIDQLDEKYGALNWTAVPMDDADKFPADDADVPAVDPRAEESIPEYDDPAD